MHGYGLSEEFIPAQTLAPLQKAFQYHGSAAVKVISLYALSLPFRPSKVTWGNIKILTANTS